jgi:hypothetical protein
MAMETGKVGNMEYLRSTATTAGEAFVVFKSLG